MKAIQHLLFHHMSPDGEYLVRVTEFTECVDPANNRIAVRVYKNDTPDRVDVAPYEALKNFNDLKEALGFARSWVHSFMGAMTLIYF